MGNGGSLMTGHRSLGPTSGIGGSTLTVAQLAALGLLASDPMTKQIEFVQQLTAALPITEWRRVPIVPTLNVGAGPANDANLEGGGVLSTGGGVGNVLSYSVTQDARTRTSCAIFRSRIHTVAAGHRSQVGYINQGQTNIYVLIADSAAAVNPNNYQIRQLGAGPALDTPTTIPVDGQLHYFILLWTAGNLVVYIDKVAAGVAPLNAQVITQPLDLHHGSQAAGDTATTDLVYGFVSP
jgi:hypothetical protein